MYLKTKILTNSNSRFLIFSIDKGKYSDQKNLYESLLKSSNLNSNLPTNNDESFYDSIGAQKQNVKSQIMKDVHRTFSNLDVFSYVSIIQKLYRVLYSYFIYDPQLGYTQGMNLLAGALIMHTEENIAFWLFVTLLEEYDMRDVFDNAHTSINKHSRVLNKLIGHYMPDLFEHIHTNDITVDMFSSGWILSLF